MKNNESSNGMHEQSIPTRIVHHRLPPKLSVSREQLDAWLDQANLNTKNVRELEGFEITSSIDGNLWDNREVSYVKITSGQYHQHIHKNSDARFYIISGKGEFLSGKERKHVAPGDIFDVPRGLPHGFELQEGEEMTFVSVQSPPIRDPKTGEEDLHLTDLV